MGLSSKQVSSDGHNGWNQTLLQDDHKLELPKPPSLKRQASQQQQQQPEPLNCPRCDSANTKFCYYNNYNKSQPRHFCKACKRHWTKGGTLRNVPVGGGRKNKRIKTSNVSGKPASKANITTTTTTPTTTTTSMAAVFSGIGNNNSNNMSLQPLTLPTLSGVVDNKSFTDAFYHNLVRQPESNVTFTSKGLNDGNNGLFLGSTLSLSQNIDKELQFPYCSLNLGSFEGNQGSMSSTISSSIQPSNNVYNYAGERNNAGFEENGMKSLNTSMSSSSMSDHQQQQAWEMPTSNVMDMSSNNWCWDDFDKFVSVEADLAIPWDDSDQIKP